MLIRALEFCGITFGITLVVGFLVAGIIKLIGRLLQRGEKTPQTKSQ
jgi:hypothetical protein